MKFEAEVYRQYGNWYIYIPNIPEWLADEFLAHRNVQLGSTTHTATTDKTETTGAVLVTFKLPQEENNDDTK